MVTYKKGDILYHIIGSFNRIPFIAKYEVLEDYEHSLYFGGIKLKALDIFCSGFSSDRTVVGKEYYGRELYGTDGGYHRTCIFDEIGLMKIIFEKEDLVFVGK